MPMNTIYDEERAAILAQVPAAPDATALRQGQQMRTRDFGRIPQSTRDDWLRMIRDPSYDLQFRQLIHRTAKEALTGIGEPFDEPEPVIAKGE